MTPKWEEGERRPPSRWGLLIVIAVLAIGGLVIWLIWDSTSTSGSSATPTPTVTRGSWRASAPAPVSGSLGDMAAEAEVEEDLWREERRAQAAAANWIWRPTAEDLQRAKERQRGAYFRAPILDEETGASLEGEVWINGEPVARAARVELLMWDTAESPLRVRVEAEGYEPWGVEFRFEVKELKIINGQVELPPAGVTAAAD